MHFVRKIGFLFLSGVALVVAFFTGIARSSILENASLATALSPNEMGTIMVLMYHYIRTPESEWARTPKNFEKDLVNLYTQGFRPVSLYDLIDAQMDLPRGTSPVVLTFDDATIGQFRIVTDADGNKAPDPESAVGILERFHAAHPDFPLKATFFVHGRVPFQEPGEIQFKLNYIVSRGMDIGNHTTAHQNLRLPENASPQKIQAAIGRQATFLERNLTKHPDYKVNLFALCYGRRPKQTALGRFLVAGSVDGIPYRNLAVLNVGSGPSFSPFDKRFNPLSIPRVRASEIHTAGVGLYSRLHRYAEHPETRYVSDGDPHTITIPLSSKKYFDFSRLQKRSDLITTPAHQPSLR